MTNGYGYLASLSFCSTFTDGVMGTAGTAWDNISRAALSTQTIPLGAGEPAGKVSALDYADQEILAGAWITNPGPVTGSMGDSLVSLATTILFPIATTAWGVIEEIYFATDWPYSTGLVTFAGPLASVPTITIGDQLVFLGSATWGSGAVTLTMSYT